MKQTIRKQEAGTAIVLVISILATLMVIVGVAAEYTMSISRNVQRSTTLENAVAVADGCLENNFAYWRQLCRTPGQNLPTTNQLAGLDAADTSAIPKHSKLHGNASRLRPDQCFDRATMQSRGG